MKNKRGQGWGFDLVAAMIIFLAGILFLYFYTINYPSATEEIFQQLHHEGELVADSLLSEGSPSNWNQNNVVRIGLLNGNKINETKLETFSHLDYNKTKYLFRINHEYYVKFQEPISFEGGIPTDGIGLPPTNERNLAKITRVVIYNNEIKSLEIYAWN